MPRGTARILKTRDALLNELAGTRYENLVVFDAVPVVALHASVEAVEVMRRSDSVAFVEEDVAVGIGGGPGAVP